MALRILEKETQDQIVSKGFSWDAWYAANKQRLSEKRAKRYREDPAYREAALKRSRSQRAVKVPVTDGYVISFNDVAREVGVTPWVLREWRKKDYFPEPRHRDGRLWFNKQQIELLKKLQEFFVEQGVRVSESKREALQGVTAWVYSNW